MEMTAVMMLMSIKTLFTGNLLYRDSVSDVYTEQIINSFPKLAKASTTFPLANGINRIIDVVDYLGCARMQRVSTRRLLCIFLFKILEGAGDMAWLLRAANVLS